jgi:hypothetical protein
MHKLGAYDNALQWRDNASGSRINDPLIVRRGRCTPHTALRAEIPGDMDSTVALLFARFGNSASLLLIVNLHQMDQACAFCYQYAR